MLIALVGDVHWSRYSSIVRGRGEKYSQRLENCIQSINWVEDLCSECDEMVYLGDFFDGSELNSEEITALQEIEWNSLPHKFLVGNHEMGISDLQFSSSHAFKFANMEVIDKPTHIINEDGDNILYLPYQLEDSRKQLKYYFNEKSIGKSIIFSHNDIAGIQLGPFKTIHGFSIQEIQEQSDLFINGHLHNGNAVANNIINIGNLTGQNFSEDAKNYSHNIFILDTKTLNFDVYENPYAFNFYKLDTTKGDTLEGLKSNAVITLKTNQKNATKYRDLLDNNGKIVASRLIIENEITHSDSNEEALESLSINHLEKFREFILEELGDSEEVLEELTHITQ